MLIIDNITYNVDVIKVERKAEFLDKYAERTEDGDLKRELIGVYYNYSLSIAPSSAGSTEAYDALWNKLTEPTEYHIVTMPAGCNSNITFKAYFSGVKDTVFRALNGKNHFKGLTVNLIAKMPARK